MSRRNLPPIDPTDLRDHADGERIDRVWARLEHNLPSQDRARKRLRGTTVALLAAALGAFAGGVLVGRFVYDQEPIGPAPIASVAQDQPESNIFAAGSQGRTFSLPGGGQLRLGPGATVEMERIEGDVLTLRLVQGHAEVSAEQRAAGLAVVAGEARLTSPAGSVVVLERQAGADVMNVRVSSGVVAIVSPNLSNERLEAGDEPMPVRLRAITAIAPTPVHRRAPAPTMTTDPAVEPAPVAVAAPSWQTRHSVGEYGPALKLLREQPGGIVGAIAAAKTAGELMNIAEVAFGSDLNAEILAYKKVVDQFPGDKNAGIAARRLAAIYSKLAEKGDAQAAQQAEMYRERTKQLDQQLSPFATCLQLRNAEKANKKDDARRHAEDYLKIDPNGDCRDDAHRVLAGETLEAEEPAPPAPAESTTPAPKAPPATSSSAPAVKASAVPSASAAPKAPQH